MDEIRVSLKSKFVRGILSRILSSAIKAKIGYDLDIKITSIAIKDEDSGNLYVQANLESVVPKDFIASAVKNLV